ncbi:MAG: glycosyltransferase family 4 protein [Pirellulales bacterium]
MLRLLPFLRGFRGKKVVFLHGIEVWRPQPPALLKKLKSVDLFLSNSDFTWSRFLDFAPQLANHRHITTPLGFGSPLGQTEAVPGRQNSVLIIARMHKAEDYKGHRQLIQAWPLVMKRVPTAVLDIVGEGDLKPQLQELAKELGVQGNVKFHGRVGEVEKENLLRSCGVFAMPSRGEGFGIVYLEAMRYGRPCIVSNCDAAREVVNPPEAGLEVDPDNVEQLAGAVTELLTSDEMWTRISKAATARYEASYTASAYRKRLWAAVDSVLDLGYS